MPVYTQYVPGDWNACCDVCGRRFKASQLRQRWDGVMVCSDDFEMRHPQELIRPVQEQSSVPFTRPVNESFISNPSSVPLDPVPTGTFNPDTL